MEWWKNGMEGWIKRKNGMMEWGKMGRMESRQDMTGQPASGCSYIPVFQQSTIPTFPLPVLEA